MNFYVTSGTPDYMEKLIAKNAKEPLILLHGNGNSIVLHESEKKSIFAVPRKFEILDSKGSFEQKAYFTIYNMSVQSENRPVFEKQVLDAIPPLKTNDGVIAYRFLRPIKADIYLLIIQWGGPSTFEAWKNTENYQKTVAPILEGSASAIQSMFNSSSYITTYSAPPKE